jgi:hypothetical protein
MPKHEITIRQLDQALEALCFYANPENYHAMTITADPPCGAFADDFSEDHGFDHYDRPMPGAKARAALRAMGIRVGGSDDDREPDSEEEEQ